jgi:ABC-type nitrate/sulfonate/bicarbonate transport system substrate-binding protein
MQNRRTGASLKRAMKYGMAMLTLAIGMISATPRSEAVLIHVKAGNMVALDMAPLFVAKESGCFAKYGLDVQTVFFPNPGDQNVALAGGSLDFATIPFTLAYLAANNGVQVRVVAGAGGWGIQEVIAQKSLGIKSMADLKTYVDSGKPPLTIAVLQGDTLEMIVRTALAKEGIDQSKVKFVYFDDLLGMVDAFKAGHVDILSHIKPYTTAAELSDGATLVTTSAETWSTYTPNTVVAVLNKTLQARHEVVKAYLEGLVCAANIINQTPETAVSLLSKGNYFRVSPAALLQAFKSAPAPISFVPDTTSIKQVVQDMAKLGYINGGINDQGMYDFDMIKSIEANELTK